MMCEHANCEHSREDIARLVVGPRRPRATATTAAPEDKHVGSSSPSKERDISYQFVLHKVETPKPRERQSDIRPFFTAKTQSTGPLTAAGGISSENTKSETNDAFTVTPEKYTSGKYAPCCGSATPSHHSDDEEDKKPAASTAQVFAKVTSEGTSSYVPIVIDSSEWNCLPRGVYLANDLDGTDPNRIVVVVENDVDEVPDFILDSIPTPSRNNIPDTSK